MEILDCRPWQIKIAVKVIDQTGMEHMTVIDDPRKDLHDPRPSQPDIAASTKSRQK